MKHLTQLFEPKKQIEEAQKLFSNFELKELIWPLFIEQLLVMLVGIADTLMVSYAGEAAVSGVSLVNMFTTIFIYLFTALAAGGSVIVSQYLGKRSREKANLAGSQIFTVSFVFSMAMMLLTLAFNRMILRTLFGSVSADVMNACIIYLNISAYSFPAIALYNAAGAVFRSMGNSKTPMIISIIMNIINIIGNYLGVFIFHAGVAGVAWPSFISRVFAALLLSALCFKKTNPVNIDWKGLVSWHQTMINRILGIAVPNGIEQGLFQLTKVALGSIVALFGTSQIAANGVAQSIWSLAAVIGVALGPVYITVVGRCMGKGDTQAAEYYMSKLTRIAYFVSIIWNMLILVLTPAILSMYSLTPETKQLVFELVLIHNTFNAFVFPITGPFANGLRAAGDVKFTMYATLFTTIVVRLALSLLFAITFHMGVIGIAWAMVADWCIRAAMLFGRYRSNKWKKFIVI